MIARTGLGANPIRTLLFVCLIEWAVAAVFTIQSSIPLLAIAGAQADTGDYLAFIVSGTKALAEDMAGVDEAVAKLGDAPQFARLANYDELHRGNVSRAYLRFEATQ